MDFSPQLSSILAWERFDPRRGREEVKEKLVRKVREGLWTPDPAIIVSPIPPGYDGRFTHFVYDGNTRFGVAKYYRVPLNAVIVPVSDQVERGGIIWSTRYVLKYVLASYLQGGKNVDSLWCNRNDLGELLEQFEREFG